MKIEASGKKRKRLEISRADATVHVIKREKKVRIKNEISITEMQELIGDTLERLYPEIYGQAVDRLNAVEYFGHLIAMQLKYGPFSEDGRLTQLDNPLPMIEHEFKKVPLCRSH